MLRFQQDSVTFQHQQLPNYQDCSHETLGVFHACHWPGAVELSLIYFWKWTNKQTIGSAVPKSHSAKTNMKQQRATWRTVWSRTLTSHHQLHGVTSGWTTLSQFFNTPSKHQGTRSQRPDHTNTVNSKHDRVKNGFKKKAYLKIYISLIYNRRKYFQTSSS